MSNGWSKYALTVRGALAQLVLLRILEPTSIFLLVNFIYNYCQIFKQALLSLSV